MALLTPLVGFGELAAIVRGEYKATHDHIRVA